MIKMALVKFSQEEIKKIQEFFENSKYFYKTYRSSQVQWFNVHNL